MQLETEVLGPLTKDVYKEFLNELTSKIGAPKRVRRLSIQMTDYTKQNLDTRIRITNGEAEIMQKIGDWNAKTREELSVPLPLIPDVIYRQWQILNNILDMPTVQKNIIQMDSYLFITPKFEIKLTCQSGGEDVYNFEVESFDGEINPVDICKEFNLKPDLRPKDAAYWDKFNKRVNLDIRRMDESKVFDIISAHCLSSK